MFMATSATPLGNYSSSISNSKNYTNVNFGSGNSRPRNYQSKYRTQALQNLARSQRYVLHHKLPGRPNAGALDHHLRYKGNARPNPVSTGGYSRNQMHNSVQLNGKNSNLNSIEQSLQPPPGARSTANKDTLARGKSSAPGWNASHQSKMSGPAQQLGSIVVPSTADKTRTEAQSGINSSVVKSPLSGHFASQFRSRTRYGSRGHHASD